MRSLPVLAVPLAAFALALAGCRERGADSAEAAVPEARPVAKSSAETPPAVGPHIAFEETGHDFGRISDTRKQTALFRFTNTGDETLKVQGMKPSCGCTVATLGRKEFPPGDGDVITVTFDPMGRTGVQRKTIDVVSNSRPDAVIELRIMAHIESMLRCERFLKMGDIELGREYQRVIPIEYDDPDLVLRHVTTNQPYVKARLVEMGRAVNKPGGRTVYEGTIEVTLSGDAPWGIIRGTRVQLTAYGRPDPESEPVDFVYSVYLRGGIWGQLRTDSNLISFATVKPGTPFEDAKVIRSVSGTPFTATGASVPECDIPGVEARVEQVNPAEYRLVISGTPGRHRGGFRGTAAVQTDVPGEEVINFYFAGTVR
jgi:hypothetical protein